MAFAQLFELLQLQLSQYFFKKEMLRMSAKEIHFLPLHLRKSFSQTSRKQYQTPQSNLAVLALTF